MAKLLFESATCTRCGGSGRYSFNMVHGSMCYGCGGSGSRLTKRGAEAQRYFRSLAMKPVSQLAPGDMIQTSSVTPGGALFDYAAKVVKVVIDDPEAGTCTSNGVERRFTTVVLESEKYGTSYLHTFPEVEKEVRNLDRRSRIEKALAYQETLTQAGKPKKRA